jgi:hypothetical protein
VTEVPVLLTVEEAGELLRIGRTKAYAMTREWRETGGRSGLPVIDLGNVLRVPRKAIEDLVGVDLSNAPFPGRSPSNAATPPELSPEDTADKPTQSTRRRRSRNTDQLDLFDPTIKSDIH